MNKTDIIKIAAVLVVVFFIFEMFAIGYIGGRSAPVSTGPVEIVGSADYIVTLKSYEPYLAIVYINDSQISDIKAISGVEEVIASSNGYIVSVKDRADVSAVYGSLKKLGVQGVTVANVQFPANLELTFPNGSAVSVATGGGIAQMELEPFVEIGDQFGVHSAQLKAQDGVLTAYSQPTLSPKTVTFNATAVVKTPLYGLAYVQVPWEMRGLDLGQLYLLYGQENVSYAREDTVPLQSQLSAQETISKKYDYIEFISENSVTPYANFTNSSRLAEDFNVSYFPDSSLTLVTPINDTPPLSYTVSYKSEYEIMLVSGEYSFTDAQGEMILQNVSVGDNVTVEITALSLGKSVTKILDAKQV